MITERPGSGPGTGEAEFEHERARLVGLAYRITGSRTTAEDLVQDAWLRWQRTDRSEVERPAAWLTTVIMPAETTRAPATTSDSVFQRGRSFASG